MVKMRFFAVAVMAGLVSSGFAGENNDSVFEETGAGTASKYERRVDAERRAEENALGKVMAKTKVDVVSGYSDLMAQQGTTDSQAIASYLLTLSAAAVSWERAGKPVCVTDDDGNTSCRVAIKGRVTVKGSPDPSFSIEVSTDGLKPLYKNGEKLAFSAKVSREAYLYLLSVDEERNAYLIYPCGDGFDKPLKAGTNLAFPTEGMTLAAVLPDGRDSAAEALHFIASKVPLYSAAQMKEKKVGGFVTLTPGSMRELMEKIGTLDRKQWTMRVFPYQIAR